MGFTGSLLVKAVAVDHSVCSWSHSMAVTFRLNRLSRPSCAPTIRSRIHFRYAFFHSSTSSWKIPAARFRLRQNGSSSTWSHLARVAENWLLELSASLPPGHVPSLGARVSDVVGDGATSYCPVGLAMVSEASRVVFHSCRISKRPSTSATTCA